MLTLTAPPSQTSLPKWTDVNEWEDTEGRTFHVHPARPDVALTVDVLTPYFGAPSKYHARLFVGEVFVAGVVVMGPGNFNKSDANVICGIEVHPGHRGNHYSVLLMDMLQDVIGTVWRTGTLSVSGFANAKYLQLPLVPGSEMRSTRTLEYSSVDWETNLFLH